MTPYRSDVAHARLSLRRRTFAYACAVALCTLADTAVGLHFAAPHQPTPIRLSAGVMLAAFTVLPLPAWLLILGAAGVALMFLRLAVPALPVSLASGGVHLLLPLLVAAVLVRALHGPPHLQRPRDVCWFIGATLLLSYGAAALIHALMPRVAADAASIATVGNLGQANGLGMLLIGGTILAWRTPPGTPQAAPTAERRNELITLIGITVATAVCVIWAPPIFPLLQSPYLFVPLLVWAGVRFGPRGATLGSMLLAGLLIAITLTGHGPFAQPAGAPGDRALALHLGLLALAISALIPPLLTIAASDETAPLNEPRLATSQPDPAYELDERRFQAQLLDSVQQAVIATDLQGRITYWNRYAEALYGWSAAEVLGRPIVEVTPSDASIEQAHAIMHNLQAGASWSGEFDVQHRNGTSFPVLVTDSPVVDAAGEMIGIVGVSLDIRARRAAERALQEAHSDLEARVAERTQALAAANTQLQAELGERRRAELRLAAQLRAQDALAHSAQLLLQSVAADQRDGLLGHALDALRQGIDCSHVFLLRFATPPNGTPALHAVGLAPDQSRTVEALHTAIAQGNLLLALTAGFADSQIQVGTPTDIFAGAPPLAAALERWATQTLIVAPIRHTPAEWSLLGFAARDADRGWLAYEHLLLRTAADLIRHVIRRWQAEDALAESERRFRGIFNSQFEFIGLLDPAGIVLEANTTALAFGGIKPSEVIGRPFWEAHWWAGMGAATQAQLREAINTAAQGTFIRYEVDVRGGGDQIETIDFSLKPLHNEHGAVVLLIPEGRIISEQKRAALALTRSEQRYRSLVAAAPVGIFETDAAGACIFVNERWCAIAGLAPADALGAGWVVALHPDDRAEAFADWSEFIAGRRGYHRELRYRHSNGVVRWTIVDAAALRDEHGRVIGHLGTVTDMTEQKQAELLLSASLAEKEVLLREIHHRVKNNLQVVSSLLRLQRRRVTDPHVVAALRESEQRVAVMVLVHQLLYQSAGMANLDARPYLEQLSSQLLQLYDASARSVRITVTGDEQRLSLEQAIPCGLLVHELLTNSLKYAFPQQRPGMITIDLRLIGAEVVQLAVSDDGIGLPNLLPSGASLGMRLIDGFVRQLRGSVTWSSGPGTHVTVRFPVGVPSVHSEHPLPERPQP